MSCSLRTLEDTPLLVPGSPEIHSEHPRVPAGASSFAGDVGGSRATC